MAVVSRKSLVWKGKALTERMRKAQIAGINRTMGTCVVTSKESHPWKNRSGVLEGGIGIADYAAPVERGVQGVWGVQDVNYGLIMELGGVVTAKTAKALAIPLPDGGVVFRKSVTIPAFPYLRPSADANYPRLVGNIRAAYDSSGGAPSTSSGQADG